MNLSVQDTFRIVVDIFDRQSVAAINSTYDVGVHVGAVAAAREIFIALPVEGSTDKYVENVIYALRELAAVYDDKDGEFTNGCAQIGGIISEITRTMGKLKSSL